MSRPGYVDRRGNNEDRRRRREWLLSNFDHDLGPHLARCSLRLSADCLSEVDAETLSVDRIEPGGTYRRSNIRPACKPCQDRQGGILTATGPNAAMIEAYRAVRDARDALRESGTPAPSHVTGAAGSEVAYYQLEDDDFNAAVPPVLFKDWLVGHARPRD